MSPSESGAWLADWCKRRKASSSPNTLASIRAGVTSDERIRSLYYMDRDGVIHAIDERMRARRKQFASKWRVARARGHVS